MMTTIDSLWIRIIENLVSGSTFLAIGGTCVSFLREKYIGHRQLIWYTVGFCLVRAVAHFCNAWTVWSGHVGLMFWMRAFSAVYTVCFGLAVIAAKRDLLITLYTTEAEDQERKDIARDIEQLRLNLKTLTDQAYETSKALVKEQRVIMMQRRDTDERAGLGKRC
jgi:hypothetical protein